MKEKVFKVFSDVFEIPLSEVNDTMSQENFEAWDSIMHLTLISDLEMSFDAVFEPEEIEEMTSVSAILNALNQKTV